jgi:two-component system response regulator FlrC
MSSILVVDDEPAMREFYRRVITAAGHRAIDVGTAEQGLDFLTLSPDIGVVVADLQMPGHGGAWLVDQVRQRFPNVAVILATADDTVSGAVTLQPSVVRYLVKPISTEQLLAALSAALEEPAPPAKADTGPDAIEAWLDRKLTHPHGDGGGTH